MITKNEPAFFQYLSDHRRNDFAWGVNDCMTFATGAFGAYCGVDLMASISEYADESGAKSILDGRSLVEITDDVIGKIDGLGRVELCADPTLCVVKVFGKQFGAIHTGMTTMVFQQFGIIGMNDKHVVASWGVL